MVREVIENNELGSIRIINAGVKVLTRSDARNKPCDYRLCMDGLQSTWKWLEKRVAACTLDDLGKAIRQVAQPPCSSPHSLLATRTALTRILCNAYVLPT
jgi:hypothetical protein